MNTTNDTLDSAVTAYLDAVRLYLSDLPEWDIEDLMTDIEQHVLEVASEWDGPITTLLGDPISFVDEYRQSAEVPPVTPPVTTPPLVDRIVRAIESVRTGNLWLSIRAFAQEARPGWWAVRGFLASSVLLFMVTSSSQTALLNPLVHGPLGLIPAVLAVGLSVHLGRRSQRRTWRRWIAIAANVAVVAATLVMGSIVNDELSYTDDPFIVNDLSEDAGEAAYQAGFADGRSSLSVTGGPGQDAFLVEEPDR